MLVTCAAKRLHGNILYIDMWKICTLKNNQRMVKKTLKLSAALDQNMNHFIKSIDGMSPEHSEESSGEDDSESESEDNVESADDDDEEDEQSSSDLEDNTTYQDWLAEAKETTGDLWNMKYDKYTSEGMNEDQASEKANMKTQWAVKRNFFARFKDFLSSYLHLKDDEAYQDIVWDIEDKMEKGMDINKAINRITAKHETRFSALFYAVEDEEYDEESSEENES